MIRTIALALTLLLPDRLPSLVLLVGFWIPPTAVGFAVADLIRRTTTSFSPALIYIGLAIFPLGWSAAWFLFQLNRIPPYVPGATMDPTYAPPEAVSGLAVVASALVLPGSLIACLLAFRIRERLLRRASAARLSA
jgi:hypothetical protein